MTVLILGATGMLGRALKAAFEDAGYAVYGLSSVDCDFTDLVQIETLAERYPQCKYVINAAAYTKVDQAEQEQALANRVNGEAVGVLASVVLLSRRKNASPPSGFPAGRCVCLRRRRDIFVMIDLFLTLVTKYGPNFMT